MTVGLRKGAMPSTSRKAGPGQNVVMPCSQWGQRRIRREARLTCCVTPQLEMKEAFFR